MSTETTARLSPNNFNDSFFLANGWQVVGFTETSPDGHCLLQLPLRVVIAPAMIQGGNPQLVLTPIPYVGFEMDIRPNQIVATASVTPELANSYFTALKSMKDIKMDKDTGEIVLTGH